LCGAQELSRSENQLLQAFSVALAIIGFGAFPSPGFIRNS
jgi:hypothetical protein